MHNLEQPQFESNKEVQPKLTEADRVREKTRLELGQHHEELALESKMTGIMDEFLKSLNPEAQAFLQKNNKE